MLWAATVTAEAAFPGEVLLPLALATVLSGLIGLERELHGRAAGLRTHIMVCLGTTMAMLVSMALCRNLSAGSGWRPDPGRIAAGVLTGIGFLGAGAIVKLKSTHRGLTTAACIWFVASLGVVIGAGAYALAVGGTLMALAVLLILKVLEHQVRPDVYREIVVVGNRADDLLARARQTIVGMGLAILSEEFEDEIEKGIVRAVFSVRFRRGLQSEEVVLRHLRELPGVKSITWRTVAS